MSPTLRNRLYVTIYTNFVRFLMVNVGRFRTMKISNFFFKKGNLNLQFLSKIVSSFTKHSLTLKQALGSFRRKDNMQGNLIKYTGNLNYKNSVSLILKNVFHITRQIYHDLTLEKFHANT